jgi:SPFH domain / Band 7 family
MIAVYVIKQYERAVVFKLGKVKDKARGPGLIFIVPFAQRIHRVSLRIITMPIQSQGIITKDNVSIGVSAVGLLPSQRSDPLGDRDRERRSGDQPDRTNDAALRRGTPHPG